ncbi:endolytic transglycosylase MltG [Arthrobacter sp. NIO-1057]|uniref:endolytic transglycosylase MltG n=1 Tax=Arthrobacter sp. NIO-1057 TaxID=993071 RepID=UPI00071D0634|nr:endolytic transglycosylase MltG [Arthrobacter sp. NIO-1057]KSU67972.1 hypothetical protein AS038_02455 [Arthrobacter sp. NIO-1057]SCB84732.1 UPF0755 protein [Arthrobacter sp. NIO-1057]
MREEARQERQRETHRALYESFAAGQGLPIAQPSTPELSGLGHYLSNTSEDSGSGAASEETHTQFLPTLSPAPTTQTPIIDPEAQPAVEPGIDSPDALHSEGLIAHENPVSKKQRRAKNRRKRNLVMLATVVIFALVVAGSIFFVKSLVKQFNPDDYPGPGGDTVEFTVEDGWGLGAISRKLEELDVISNDKLLIKAVENSSQSNKVIHPGTYLLKSQMPAADAAEVLVNNRPDKVFYIGLKANLRLNAALEEIAKGSGLKLDDLKKLANEPEKFGLPDSVSNLEGWLHPGEYRFALDSSAKDVMTELVNATKTTLKEAGISDLEEGYRTLKIASILQAESREKDYAVVAGAIENRLNPNNKETHGLLQVDSSVIYGLNRYSLQFSKAEKQDAANKYNTYVHQGLPPTPIGSPATSAINAAANPQANDYYYWVTVNIETGETKFASTYAQHQQNQAEFRLWCEQNPGVC